MSDSSAKTPIPAEREILRLQAQLRVQEQIWQMRSAEDIASVWQTIVDCLEDLDVPFDHCGINVIESAREDGDPGLGIVEQIWRSGETSYRPDLDRHDALGERPRIEGFFDRPVRSVIDVPFSHGTLALNSHQPNPLSPWHIEILEDFARILSSGFRRMDDLRGLEERHQALQEAMHSRQYQEQMQEARHRVREQVWRMREPDDIAAVLDAVRQNFKILSIPYDYCSINLVREDDDNPHIVVYSVKQDQPWKQTCFPVEDTLPFIALWRRGEVSHRPDLQKDDPFGELPTYKVAIRALVDVPFSHGTLAMSSLTPDVFSDDHIHVLKQMANILGEGFARLDDLDALETRNAALEREIAERRTAEEEMAVAKEQAEAANHAKSVFLANMSHELRTPLNAVLGFSQLLQRSDDLAAEQRDNVNIIAHNGEHLLTLINDVLEMSRIEAGRVTLNEVAFDLHELLDSLIETFRPRAQEQGLMLITERTGEVPRYVLADEGKLRQVLVNLLGNAIKFTEAGQVLLRVQYQADKLHLEVADTGAGIAAAQQESLFDAFVQTTQPRVGHGGTGLGLAISQQFVELLGGELEVRSEVGQGARFFFDIPLCEVSAADLAVRSSGRRVQRFASGQTPPSILIVDDRDENRLLLRRLLEPLGCQVAEAADGQEGIQQWQETQPDLVWMDIRMPRVDGYEATRQIRSLPGGETTVIVALTASAFEEDRRRVLSAGCDDFVRKPFREEDIFGAMQRHLGLRYIYEEESTPDTEPASLSSTDLASLSPDQIAELRAAANEADEDRILSLLDRWPADQADLVQALTAFTLDFRFDEIIDLLPHEEA